MQGTNHKAQGTTIATFNVNSIKARLPNVLAWLDSAKPDVVLLQELKCVTDAFPFMEIEERGYNCAVHGEKTYNGVAILSKFPISDIETRLPGEETDMQSRYIEAVLSLPGSAVRVASIYIPNGMSPDSDKFQYKLRFYDRLIAHARELLSYGEMLVLGGDYNCAPYPIDVYAPQALDGTVCFHPEERKRLYALHHLGLYDAYRLKHPQTQEFSWWDYRGGSFESGKGLRIDHLLLSAQAADRLDDCWIDAAPRAQEKASDHTPVVAKIQV